MAEKLKIGFIGLGIMGTPMAGHLRAAGHELYVKSRSGTPEALTQAGAVTCADAKEVAQRADVIFIMVPDTPHVEDVLFSDNGVANGIAATVTAGTHKVVVDMSSISPIATKEFAKRIQAVGADYLDAPVSGGEVGAKGATLTIMVGGSQETFDRVKPLFELMGKNITLVGGNGDGQTCKVANQIIVALNIQAVSEALLFASKAGADPAKVRSALMGGFASSRILEVHGERMLKRTFNPGFRIELHQKDLNLALQSAKAIGAALPNTAMAQELFNTCVAHGLGQKDHSALCQAVEIMSDHAIAGEGKSG
jgi:2-hydroxy-3-oxopropionate reductase